MGVTRYQIMLIDAKNKQEQLREWSAAELMRSVAWLKRMNARGHDVLIAPAGQHGLVLLDGLGEEALADMTGKGFEPAATIQSAPGRYQAWVKLSDRPLADDVRQHACKGLEKAFGQRTAKAERAGYGSLAGFTSDGTDKGGRATRRYVLALHTEGAVAKNASELLDVIRQANERPTRQRDEIFPEKPKLAPKQRGPSR